MVVCDLYPAATVEGSGFKVLINYIKPGYRVPSAYHIAEVARWNYLSGKSAISSYLQLEAHYMAFKIDIWISRVNDAYLSLTMQSIDDSWNMVSIILATAPFLEHHAAANIVSKVKQVIDRLLSVMHATCR